MAKSMVGTFAAGIRDRVRPLVAITLPPGPVPCQAAGHRPEGDGGRAMA
ncbi:hypothetical protein [Amaricoccus sp.]|nr:hypothetical protein [Amaricoccus sp.]HRW14873.1 hypothetical protein [Amaricoccus sp.]